MRRSEELFSLLKQSGAAEILRMIASPVVEELFLDYKRTTTVSPFSQLDPSDRKNLSRAVAGFANSEGGVIVWGVDCRPDPPNGDVPIAPLPISNPTAFKTLLDNALSGVTLPAHSTVENIAMPMAHGTEGFVVTHIPIGSGIPYRTLGSREEYYIRAGSNFVPTPHSVLAGMFGRAPQPRLNIIAQLRTVHNSSTVPGRWLAMLEISLANDGRGIAEDVFINVEVAAPPTCIATFEITEQWTRWRTNRDGRDRFTAIANSLPPRPPPIPPGAEALVLVIRAEFGPRIDGDLAITLGCGAKTGPGAARQIVLPRPALQAAADHYTNQDRDKTAKASNDSLHERALAAHIVSLPR